MEVAADPQEFDFKPLESFELPGIGSVQCDGLTVIVGPNSSGKSQLLQDIYLRLCGEPRALVVATGFTKLRNRQSIQNSQAGSRRRAISKR